MAYARWHVVCCVPDGMLYVVCPMACYKVGGAHTSALRRSASRTHSRQSRHAQEPRTCSAACQCNMIDCDPKEAIDKARLIFACVCVSVCICARACVRACVRSSVVEGAGAQLLNAAPSTLPSRWRVVPDLFGGAGRVCVSAYPAHPSAMRSSAPNRWHPRSHCTRALWPRGERSCPRACGRGVRKRACTNSAS